MREVGHAGLANLSKPITAYDLHVRFDKIKSCIPMHKNTIFPIIFMYSLSMIQV